MKHTIKTTSENVALLVMRTQPLHNGHINLIFQALVENDTVIIALGSTNQEESFNNPYGVGKRINMLKKVFGTSSKIKVITLKDIQAQNNQIWTDYVYDQIDKLDLPQPNRYYAGDFTNANYYKVKNKYTNQEPEIKMLNRLNTGIMSATMIRQNLSLGLEEWKEHVPVCLHEYVENNFPKKFLTENIDGVINF